MSVIWSGITEGGAVVPVQVTEEGKVVAVGDGPQGDYLPITGGTLTGDLKVEGVITGDGSALFSAGVTSTGYYVRSLAANGGVDISFGKCCIRQDSPFPVFQTVQGDGNNVTSSINGDGSASFNGPVSVVGLNCLAAIVNSNRGVGLLFSSGNTIIPTNAQGAGVNGLIDLGSASFKFKDIYLSGSPKAANYIVELEADDETKYTTTTGAGGDKTRVYNGAILDVKETLLDYQSKIQALEAARTALEARVVTLEAQQP